MIDTLIQILRYQWREATSAAAVVIAVATYSLSGIYIARQLQPTDYGKYAYFLGVYGLALLIGSLGLATRVTNAFKPSPNERKFFIESLFVYRLISTIPFLILSGIIVISGGDQAIALGLVVASINLIRVFLAMMIGGSGAIIFPSITEAIQASTYLVMLFVGLRNYNDLSWVFISLIFSQSLTLCLAAVMTIHRKLLLPGLFQIRLEQLRNNLRETFGSLVQIYLLSILIAANGSYGNFVLGYFGFLPEAGLMSIGITVAGVSALIGASLVTNLYYPRLCAYINTGRQSLSDIWASLFYRLFAMLAIMWAVFLTIYGSQVVELLYTPKYLPAVKPMIILGWSSGIIFLFSVLSWAMIANLNYSAPLMGAIPQFILLVVGGLLVVRLSNYPLEGLVWIYLAASLLGWSILTLLAHRHRYSLIPEWRIILAGIGAFVTSYLLANWLASIGISELVSLTLSMLMSGLICLVLLIDRSIIANFRILI